MGGGLEKVCMAVPSPIGPVPVLMAVPKHTKRGTGVTAIFVLMEKKKGTGKV